MASLNKVILIGNLTKDPELKQTPSGVSVTSFSIGVSRKYSGADGNRETDRLHQYSCLENYCGIYRKILPQGKRDIYCRLSASQKLRQQRTEAICYGSCGGRSGLY